MLKYRIEDWYQILQDRANCGLPPAPENCHAYIVKGQGRFQFNNAKDEFMFRLIWGKQIDRRTDEQVFGDMMRR